MLTSLTWKWVSLMSRLMHWVLLEEIAAFIVTSIAD